MGDERWRCLKCRKGWCSGSGDREGCSRMEKSRVSDDPRADRSRMSSERFVDDHGMGGGRCWDGIDTGEAGTVVGVVRMRNDGGRKSNAGGVERQ